VPSGVGAHGQPFISPPSFAVFFLVLLCVVRAVPQALLGQRATVPDVLDATPAGAAATIVASGNFNGAGRMQFIARAGEVKCLGEPGGE
jgi:hypothetical protein